NVIGSILQSHNATSTSARQASSSQSDFQSIIFDAALAELKKLHELIKSDEAFTNASSNKAVSIYSLSNSFRRRISQQMNQQVCDHLAWTETLATLQSIELAEDESSKTGEL